MSGTSRQGHTTRMRRRGALLVSGAALLGALAAGSPAAADDSESRDYRGAAASVSAGGVMACVIADTGSVYCWGDNTFGILGYGEEGRTYGNQEGELEREMRRVDLGRGRTARVVSSGGTDACAILDDAQLTCWGRGAGSGLDTLITNAETGAIVDSRPVRPRLGTGRHVKSVSVGNGSTCAVLDDRSVKCFGGNAHGQLGLGDRRERFGEAELGDALPAVDLGGPAARVSLGDGFACALMVDASVKCWGKNDVGQLGQGDRRTRGDNPGEMGAALRPVDLRRGAIAIAAGESHACALLDNGTVACWGDNRRAALGTGPVVGATARSTDIRGDQPGEMGAALPVVQLATSASVVGVSAGSWHTCAVTRDGKVWCWGSSAFGEVRWKSTATETCVPRCTTPALDAPGRSVIAVSAGSGVTCAVLDDRTLRCWSTLTGHGSIFGPPPDVRPPAVPLPYKVVRPDVIAPPRQPDLQIKVGTSGFAGNDIYAPDGFTRSGPVAPGGRTTYVVRLQNDAVVSDTFLVTARPANPPWVPPTWRVAYWFGNVNITKQVLRGGWTSPSLRPGETLDITIRVRLPATEPASTPFLVGEVTAISLTNRAAYDEAVFFSKVP